MKRIELYAAVLLLVMLMSCREPSLESYWRNSGNTDDSSAKYSSYILNGKNVVVALQNDDKNLYLRIKAADRIAQQKMIGGLTVWLDTAGKKKNFGIQYPYVSNIMMPDSPPRGDRGRHEKPGGFERPGGFPGLISDGRDSILILGPGKDERRVISVKNQLGITASISEEQGPMVLDLTIPLGLSDDSPYAIGVKAGGLISLGIETVSAKPRFKEKRDDDRPKPGGNDSFGDQGGGGKSSPGGFGDGGDWGGDDNWGDSGGGSGSGPSGGGGSGFGGGGKGGHGGGGPRGGKPGGSPSGGIDTKPLKFWAKVKLASAEQAAQ